MICTGPGITERGGHRSIRERGYDQVVDVRLSARALSAPLTATTRRNKALYNTHIRRCVRLPTFKRRGESYFFRQ